MRFSTRSATGAVCCETDDPSLLCPACKTRAAQDTTRATDGYAPPDPYAPGLAEIARRTTCAAPTPWPAQPSQARGSTPPTSPATEGYAPPDPYAPSLAKLKEKTR